MSYELLFLIKNLNHRWFSCEHKLSWGIGFLKWNWVVGKFWWILTSCRLLNFWHDMMSVSLVSLISLHQWEFKVGMYQLSKKSKQMKTRRNDKTDMAWWCWTLLTGNWRWIRVNPYTRKVFNKLLQKIKLLFTVEYEIRSADCVSAFCFIKISCDTNEF